MTLVVVVMHSKHWHEQLIYTCNLWILHLRKTALQLLHFLQIYLLIICNPFFGILAIQKITFAHSQNGP